MTTELPAKDREPASARVLNVWLRDAQNLTGVAERRIGWLLASTVTVAALQRALGEDGQPLFLVKGGLFMEFHLGLGARVTKDIDTVFRGGMDEFERALDAAIAEPWGPFVLERGVLEEISGARRIVKPRRFHLKLLVKGATWRRLKVEVSFPEADLAAVAEPVPAPSTAFFGIYTPDRLAGIAMAYQVAQKLHACTDPDDPPTFVNDRVRDIPDLLLIKQHFYPDGPTPGVRAACVELFAARAAESVALGRAPRTWPPVIAAPNSEWRNNYTALAASVGITLNLDDALATLNDWILQVASQY